MIKGSCLCGAVAYEATALAGPIGHCHCRTCRKAHSAAFATTARVRRADFAWTRGEEIQTAFESTPGKLRHFCPRCGSHLVAEWKDADYVILRIGSVDEGLSDMPVVHIWTSHQPYWDVSTDGLPRFPEAAPHHPPAP
jgi:hypothetical protein